MKNKRIITFILSLILLIGFSFSMVGCGKLITVTFDGNGGTLVSGSETQQVKSVSEIVVPVYEKEGYQFESWDTALRNIDKDTRVLATWVAKKYKIFFNVNGGSLVGVNNVEVTYKGTVPTLPTPTKYGYIFAGWEVGSGTEERTLNTGDAYLLTSDTTVKAKWEPDDSVTYTITYNTNGATIPATNPTTYKVTSEDFTLASPIKEGYTFIGWKESNAPAGTEPEKDLKVSKGTVGNLSFTACFEAMDVLINRYLVFTSTNGKSYSSTFNGESIISTETIKYDGAITNVTFTPSKTNCIDAYWLYIYGKNEKRVESTDTASKDSFNEIETKTDPITNKLYYIINLYAIYISEDDVYKVTFMMSNVVKNKTYEVVVGEHTDSFTVEVKYGESLGDKLVDATPIGRAVSEEIYFTHWYYLVDGVKKKITKSTIFNANTFSTYTITLYPQLYPTWY